MKTTRTPYGGNYVKSRRPRLPAMGGLDDLITIFGGPAAGAAADSPAAVVGGPVFAAASPDAPDELQCLRSANGSEQVKALDDRRTQLSKAWNPTGYYTPDMVQQIVSQVQGMLVAAAATVATAPRTTSDAGTVIGQAVDDATRKFSEGQAYTQAADQVRARGGSGLVDAPGLKRWVLGAMGAASDAMTAAAVLQCNRSWLENVLDNVLSVFDAAAAVIVKIGGVLAKQGDFLLKVPDMIDSLLTMAKYGVVLGGAVWLYLEYKKRKKG